MKTTNFIITAILFKGIVTQSCTKERERIDLGIHLHFFREKSEHILSLDIQNVTNRRNAYAEEYDPETKSIVYYPLAGIIPILNYRIEF